MSSEINVKCEVKAELELGEPNQYLLDYAFNEGREDPATRCQIIQEFRDFIFERGEVLPHRMDDSFLLRFLRARNFIIAKAHRLIVNYYNFKEDNPELFNDVGYRQLHIAGKHNLLGVLPYLDQTGRRIMFFKIGLWDPSLVDLATALQAVILVLELGILEPSGQILGGIGLCDLEGLSASQALYLTPNCAHKVVQIMVTCMPQKIKALHIVNQPWIFDAIFSIFKPFMNDFMKQRIFVHGTNMESLHKHIDPKHLPKRYGGVHPDYNYEDWLDYFKRDKQVQKEMKSIGYNLDP